MSLYPSFKANQCLSWFTKVVNIDQFNNEIIKGHLHQNLIDVRQQSTEYANQNVGTFWKIINATSSTQLVKIHATSSPLTNRLFQEQLKFIYDTLEEFVVCGYTFFPVRDISQHLKQKSVRKPGSKTNQYEKEYGVNLLIENHNRNCSFFLFFSFPFVFHLMFHTNVS